MGIKSILTAAVTGFSVASSAFSIPDATDLINDVENIANLNSVEGSTWTAGVNKRFEGMTYQDIRGLMGTSLLDGVSEHVTLEDSVYDAVADVPADFDARTAFPGMILPIRDQQQCGSCWAFSAAEVLGDRLSIAKNKTAAVLSPEDLVSCDKTDQGCQGGQLPAAWAYLTSTGIVSDACLPYTAGKGTAPACPTKCANSETFATSKVKASKAYAINSVANMQKEIMTNGPIQVAFKVYKSFMSYKSGVYSKHFWELLPEGGHAVKVIGWGTEKSGLLNRATDYWLVANSWNTSWGIDGFFKIKRGVNECGLEKLGPPYAGMPAL